MRILLIDDLAEIKQSVKNLERTRTAKTYEEGITALQDGYWDLVYLDHDLGDENPAKTGYGILCWLERNKQYLPGEIKLVTNNGAGRKNMELALQSLYRGRDETQYNQDSLS